MRLASDNEGSKNKSSSLPKLLIPVLGIGGLGVMAVMGIVAAFVFTGWLGQPVPVLGFEQTFDQPINFPHTIHASTKQLDYVPADGLSTMEGLGLDCTFCHRTVTTQANAGVPPVAFCAACHQAIGAAGGTNRGVIGFWRRGREAGWSGTGQLEARSSSARSRQICTRAAHSVSNPEPRRDKRYN